MAVAWDLELRLRGRGRSTTSPTRSSTAPRCRRRSSSRPIPTPASAARVTVDGERARARRLAGDDRPQLGRRARRALDLDPGATSSAAATATSTPALGRIKVGPLTTPWVGNAMLCLDGEQHRLGGFDRIRSTRIDDEPTECEFELTGKDDQGPRPGLLGAAQLRRLGLRRPGRARAQHAQLLDLRPRADRRAQGPRAAAARVRRRRRLRDRHARDRPRDPAAAVSGRLSLLAVLERRPGRAQAEPSSQGVAR